ncbi:hypothetical protein [Streptomyces sp. NRRL WC-3742]|uniref:hypothetical protein n=1 Tax=Streptomyces sp. NRRL WC-3742 TaxID=1463934 RepID=UPI0018FE3F00|nr:hypothetical protein [Streptomyces sp. NRRL WC-3742]
MSRRPNTDPGISSLLVGVCPGLPNCSIVHTYLFVDGLDVITRSNAYAVGAPPGLLLRPGGPLYPLEQARVVELAAGVEVRIRLRGRAVVWGDLMYPGEEAGVVEEVRFDLAQYLTEIERGYHRWGRGAE